MSAPALTIAILGAIPDNRQRLGAETIAARLGEDVRSVRISLGVIEARGLVERRGGHFIRTAAGNAVLAAAGAAPRRPRDSLRQRLWRAMRKLRKATLADLVTVAAAGSERNPADNAGAYLGQLTRAGYLIELQRRGPRAPRTWVIVRDTGPRAPVWSRTRRIVADHNTGEVHDA